jgi:hypothetical protein
MGNNFLNAYSRVDPEISDLHRKEARLSVAAILGDTDSAEVFILALDGLLGDEPTTDTLERRLKILVSRFTSPPSPA